MLRKAAIFLGLVTEFALSDSSMAETLLLRLLRLV